MANREADIHLEKTKAQAAAAEAFQVKQAKAEVLWLELMMKGMLSPK